MHQQYGGRVAEYYGIFKLNSLLKFVSVPTLSSLRFGIVIYLQFVQFTGLSHLFLPRCFAHRFVLLFLGAFHCLVHSSMSLAIYQVLLFFQPLSVHPFTLFSSRLSVHPFIFISLISISLSITLGSGLSVLLWVQFSLSFFNRLFYFPLIYQCTFLLYTFTIWVPSISLFCLRFAPHFPFRPFYAYYLFLIYQFVCHIFLVYQFVFLSLVQHLFLVVDLTCSVLRSLIDLSSAAFIDLACLVSSVYLIFRYQCCSFFFFPCPCFFLHSLIYSFSSVQKVMSVKKKQKKRKWTFN